MAKKGGLGRGLDSLFNENATDSNNAVTVKLSDVEPNHEQPRKVFDEQALNELADSISRHGLLQPIIVRPMTNGSYSIVAGERRWRACRIAGLNEVPVIIRELDEQALAEIALIENLQREDLNAVEEAMGYRSLIDRFNLTQDEVSTRVGKSRTAVTNALRLLNLNEKELDALSNGKITAGHARALLSCESEENRALLLDMALSGASVRELEKAAGAGKTKKKAPAKAKTETSTFYSEVELSLKEELHRSVTVRSSGDDRGTLTIEFFGDNELADLASRIAGEKW